MFRRTLPAFAVAAFVALSGCGGKPGAKVVGKVTCGTNPVTGSILFSPMGTGPENTGEAVGTPLNPDGTYEIQLKTTGKHRVVVSPSDVVYPAKPGQEYPCDLSAQEHDVTPGDNQINIELKHRGK